MASTTSGPAATRGVRLPAMVRALRHRNYRLFFFGQLISLIGTWMQNVAQGWLVLRLTGSPALLGLVAAASSLPVVLLSLSAGTVADRISRHRLLLLTQVSAMLLALVLAALTLTNTVRVEHVLVLALLLGVVNAFDAPARQAFTVEMVGREDLLNAIALNSSIFNGARTVGPAVAGVLVALIGEGPAFLLNTVSFAAVIVGLLLMRLPPFAPPGPRSGGALREGLAYIRGEGRVSALLIQAGALGFFGFVYIPLLPIFARDVLGVGASGLGWLSAASGTGALAAALLLAGAGDKIRRGRLVTGSALAYGPLMIAFSLSRSLPLSMALLALSGFAGVVSMALTNTLIQSIVPDSLRGRVMSAFTLLMLGTSPMGGMFAGLVAEVVGSVPLVVGGSAAISLLIVLVSTARAPVIRQM